MLWHYTCPDCHQPTSVDWSRHEEEVHCPHCHAVHYPPTPHEDHYAWIEGREWPPEMEEAVTTIRGTICAVTGCYKEHETLAHRVPHNEGGKTSVDNLMPLCRKHAATKGERQWDEWMAETRKQLQDEAPKMEITITARKPIDTEAEAAVVRHPGQVQHVVGLTGADATRLFAQDPGPAPHLVLAVPFLRGPASHLTLDYDWAARASGKARVFLLAWPRGEKPDLAPLGGPKFAGLFAVKEHLAVSGEKGNAKLDLYLPAGPDGRWDTGIAIVDEGGRIELGEFVIGAVT